MGYTDNRKTLWVLRFVLYPVADQGMVLPQEPP